MRRSLLLAVLCLPLLLSACRADPPEERWRGESVTQGVPSDLELTVTNRGPGVVSGRYVVGAVRGLFDGALVGEALEAELRPSDTCVYALVGTMGDSLLEASFAPSDCPGGQTGTWRLERQ